MSGDGLMIDAGPSGTTDEVMQTPDYFGVSKDLYGACAIRDMCAANMNIYEHHSYAEVVQGAFSSDRPAELEMDYDHPYKAVEACDAAVTKLQALANYNGVLPKKYRDLMTSGRYRVHAKLPPKNTQRIKEAMIVYKELMNPQSTKAKALAQTDFGAGVLAHPFLKSAEDPKAQALLDKTICKVKDSTKINRTGVFFKMLCPNTKP